MNKLLANQKKALDVPKKPAAKAKSAPKTVDAGYPAPAPFKSDRKIGGLPEDRYYRAEGALRDMARVNEIKGDSKLHADMRRVADHKKAELDRALEGGLKKK